MTSDLANDELGRLIEREAQALALEFRGTFERDAIDRVVADTLETFRHNPAVQQFVPMLVRRYSRERLNELAQTGGPVEDAAGKPNVSVSPSLRPANGPRPLQ